MEGTYGAIASFKTVQSLLAVRPCLSRRYCFDALLDDLPELVVLFAYEENDSGGLRIEATGHVQDGVVDDLLNARLGNWDLFIKGVDGAARGHDVEEGLGFAGHPDCW